jgi:hypothetical protein
VVERFATPAVAADLSRAVRDYKATEHFEPGDRVDHPTFGQGVVEVSESGKVTIFFATGRKVLVQAKGEPGKGLSRPRPFDHTVGMSPPKHAPHGHVHAPAGEDADEDISN